MSKIKVCHVIASTEGGTWMFEQLRELRDQYGYEVFAVVSGEKGSLVEKLKSENIPYFAANFDFGTQRSIMRLPLTILELAKIFQREKFDVVQTHLFFSMIIGRIAAWLVNVPARFEMIASPFHLNAYTSRWIDRDTSWMDTALIPSCKKTLDLCKEMGVPEENLELIYYSADKEHFFQPNDRTADLRKEFGWSSETPLIANVAYFYPVLSSGRWIPENLANRAIKGHEYIVESMPYILEKFPDAKLLFIGKGWGDAGIVYMESIRHLVASKKLENSIIFTGYRSDVNNILKSADVAVQASLEENLGGTIESLMIGCPTVATRVGGMPDAVIDGETGVLVEPENAKDLARGINELLSNKRYAAELSKNGQKFACERFSLDRTVEDLNLLYRKKLKNNDGRRYDLFTKIYRSLLLFPILTYIAFRLLVIDMFIPIYSLRLKGIFWRIYWRTYYLFFIFPYHRLRRIFYLIFIFPYHLSRRLLGKIYIQIKKTKSGRKILAAIKLKTLGKNIDKSTTP